MRSGSFGDALRFNPHFHALILEGGFDPNGQFYFLPIHDTARLTQLLRQRTVGLFLKLGLITEQFSETLLCWRHSGFSTTPYAWTATTTQPARPSPST